MPADRTIAEMGDRRNQPAIIGSLVAGAALFAALWLLLEGSPLLAWIAAWSIPTFAIYAIDKAQAGRGGWRVPEWLLHALALGGGVVGAWVGRLALRHKTQKPLFLMVLVAASVLWGALAAWVLLERR
jgi:uncharacterized membrane protein YsdA (DUF1294 family)